MKGLLIIAIFLVCCTTSKKQTMISSVETLQTEIMGHSVEQLKENIFLFKDQVLSVKDTTLEDEGESWNGLNYYYGDSLLFIAETSWKNRDTIVRINTENYLLKTNDGLGVGESFESIRPHVNFSSWKDFPDGYVAFKGSSDNRIIYTMDVDQHPELREGALIIDQIPPHLKVKSITLMR